MLAEGGGVTKFEQVQGKVERDSKFWSFCDNIITECPLFSATPKCIVVLFEQYGHFFCTQKSPCNTFCICKNWMKLSLQILKNKNLFKRHKYPSPNALNIKYFWTLSYYHWGFWVSLNYLILNFKKTICPKSIWIENCYCIFLLCSSEIFCFSNW